MTKVKNVKSTKTYVYKKPVYDFRKYEVSSECTKEIDVPLLIECLTQQAESFNNPQQFAVQEFVCDKLEEWNIDADVERDEYGNMYITKTETHGFYVGCVAHVDDVHDYNIHKTVLQHGDFLYAMDISNMKQIGTAGK